MTEPAQLTIRAFAEASRLSIKALRLYDELGLPPPERVDSANGYRYYSPAQLPQAQLIGLLRQLDLPLIQYPAMTSDTRALAAGLRQLGELHDELLTQLAPGHAASP